MIDRLARRLLSVLARSWLPLLLVGGLVLSVVSSVDAANWVDEDRPVLESLFFAVLFGWLLARSRFGGVFTLLYSLLVGMAAALQVVGGLLPPRALLNEGLWLWVDELNLRAVRFSLRAGGWAQTIQGGGNVDDPGLFVLLLALVVWGAILWLMWFMLRKRRVLVGLLPLGLLMAVNVNLSRQPLSYFFVFLLFALLLVAREAFTRRHQDWEARRVDYPDQLGVEWSFSALLVTLAVLTAARLAPLVGTPEGWQVLAEWARSANRQTADTAEQLFSGVNTPPPAPEGGKPEIYAFTPNLSQVGSPLPQGIETIMWVYTSDPPPLQEQYGFPIPDFEAKGHYWRSDIFAEYTGRGWQAVSLSGGAAASPFPDAAPGEEAPPGRYFLRQEYEMAARHGARLFSVSEPVKAGGGASLRRAGPDGSLLVEGRGDRYTVVSAATRVNGDMLARAPADYPDEIRAAYLQLPAGLPERVGQLADRITAGAATPFHKAQVVQDYLRSNYEYQLSAPPAPAGRDVVDYFLFENPQGFCSHYASAMTVMLRTQGVPARVATGYATGDWDRTRSAYRVTPSSAHAWVEVYFPGYGWVEFEPTASQAVFAYPEIAGAGPSAGGDTRQAPDPARPAPRLLLPLLAAAALALLALPFFLMRIFRAAGGDPAQQVNTLYRQMRLALGWAGLESAASVTPDEYLLQTRRPLEDYGRIRQALRRTTDLYRQALYSPRPPGVVDARIAGDLWRNAIGEWIVLWAREQWRKARERVEQD